MNEHTSFRRKVRRLVRDKIRVLMDTCSVCAAALERREVFFCDQHRREVISMLMNPKKYAKELREGRSE